MGGCPLIWHQTLLCFVQRYKHELTANQVQAIRNLVRVQQHHAVTAEIRRELLAVDKAGTHANAAAGGAGAAGAFGFGSQHLAAALAGSSSGAPAVAALASAAKPAFTSLAASLQNPQSFSMQD